MIINVVNNIVNNIVNRRLSTIIVDDNITCRPTIIINDRVPIAIDHPVIDTVNIRWTSKYLQSFCFAKETRKYLQLFCFAKETRNTCEE